MLQTAEQILDAAHFRRLLDEGAFAVARRRSTRARFEAAAEATRLLRSRRERRALRRVEALRRALVPPKFWPVMGATLVPTAALHAVGALGGRRCLVILSGPGDASKSTAAASVLLRLGGLWVDAERLLDVWCGGGRAQLLDAPALVLDDLARPGGSVEQRAAIAEAAEQLLHLRSEALRVTVATTNYDRDHLRAFVSASRTGTAPAGERWERLRERLREHGVQPDEHELQRLGGKLAFSGFVGVPYEGLRDPAKRAQVLAGRGAAR